MNVIIILLVESRTLLMASTMKFRDKAVYKWYSLYSPLEIVMQLGSKL